MNSRNDEKKNTDVQIELAGAIEHCILLLKIIGAEIIISNFILAAILALR